VVRDEQLVPGLEAQRAQDRVDAGGGVGDEHKIVRVRAEKSRQRVPRRVQQGFQIAHQELHGLALEPLAQPALELQYDERAAAKRAVVQKDDARVERPEGRIRGR
jgi:hypothetical protein